MKKSLLSRGIASALAVCMTLSTVTAFGSAVSLKQEIVTEPAYEAIYEFTDGYAPVQDASGKWGFIGEDGELAVACKYDWAGYNNEGVALVGMYEEVYHPYLEDTYDGTQFYLVDMEGMELKLEIDNPCTRELEGGDSMMTYSCYNGVVNVYGTPFTAEGEKIRVADFSKLDISGRCYDYALQTGPCVNGLIPMCTNGVGQMPAYQTFLMDTDGNIVMKFAQTDELGLDGVVSVWPTENDLIIVKAAFSVEEPMWWSGDIEYGIMDLAGNWVVEVGGFQNFWYLSEGQFFCDGLLVIENEDGKFGAINAKGETVIPCTYDDLYPFCEGYSMAEKNGSVFYIDTAGTPYYAGSLDGSAAEVTELGAFENGYAPVEDADGRQYLISIEAEGDVFPAVKNSEGASGIGASSYVVDGSYGVCINTIEKEETPEEPEKPDDPVAEAGDSFIYVNGVKLELSKPILETREITYADYVLLPEEEQNAMGTLRKRVEKTVTLYTLEENTTVSFPYGYTWGTEFGYQEEDGVYDELWAGPGYVPAWAEDFEMPVVWTLDNVSDGYVICWSIENVVNDTSHGNLFFEVRAAEPEKPEEPDVPDVPDVPDTPDKPVVNPFVDVKSADYFYAPVLWAVENNITAGMDPTHFSPQNPCTRGQVVTFLWRAAGEPEPTTTVNPFSDVKTSDYYYKAVLWAVEQGITNGMGDGTFAPGSTCTRGQVVTFQWRAAGEPKPSSAVNPFPDVKASDYYYKAVLWAVEQGITNGMDGGKFAPGLSCTRGQIVTFLYRAD